MEKLLEKLDKIIRKEFDDIPKEYKITKETKFLEDLGKDSLDIYEIGFGIEKALKIKLPNKLMTEIETVGEIIDYLEEKYNYK